MGYKKRAPGDPLPRTAGRDGQPWRRLRLRVLDAYGGVCGICGHPGANDIDHKIPRSQAPELAEDPDNLQPAHGATSPCFKCQPDEVGRNCNGEKATGDMEPPLVTTEDWFDCSHKQANGLWLTP